MKLTDNEKKIANYIRRNVSDVGEAATEIARGTGSPVQRVTAVAKKLDGLRLRDRRGLWEFGYIGPIDGVRMAVGIDNPRTGVAERVPATIFFRKIR